MEDKIYVGIDAKKTGERIQTLRKEKGITVEKLCDVFSVSPQAVYKWQRGDTLPSLDNMLMLCRVLETPIEKIVVMKQEDRGLER